MPGKDPSMSSLATGPHSGAGPAFRPDEADRGVPLPPGWSLRSCMDLGALPSAVPCARLHARQVLWEWGLESLAETAELILSEILTNAVNASATAAGGHRGEQHEEGLPFVWFCLASDRRSVLVQVWDDSPGRPARQDEETEAENGRGLLLVEHLSAQWGTYVPQESCGKVVWAMCGAHSSP